MRHLFFVLMTAPLATLAACEGKVVLGDLPDSGVAQKDGSIDDTIDANVTCATGAARPTCLRGGHCSCDDNSPNVAPICVDNAWACPAGSTRFEDCGGVPPGPSCFDSGSLADVVVPPDAAPADCVIASTSSLTGVSIAFAGTRCTFTLAEAAAGVQIPYQIVVADDLSVDAKRQYWGNCGASDASGLFPFERLSGNGQSYALVDMGLPCPDAGAGSLVGLAHKGSYPMTFKWDGRNWGGPSDTSTPEGALFPAGDYTLAIDAAGDLVSDGGTRVPYDVNLKVHVVLTQ